MNTALLQRQEKSLLDDPKTLKKLELNFRKNAELNHSPKIDAAAAAFRYADWKGVNWNPEEHSLLFGTPLWDQSSPSQRVILNHLYWVAYYAQIISAEIATILLNQTAGAGLYGVEDFRLVCDTLDLETSQERAHIAGFKKVGEEVEETLFGRRLFTYPMRSMFDETMIFSAPGRIRKWWRSLQLRAYTMLSSGNAFIGCQYFTVRGLRTLNGKMIQQPLSRFCGGNPEEAPLPSRISHYHFMDESFHFNSSGIIAHDVIRSLKPPTRFEAWVANTALYGCQRDHYPFSIAIRGIFWYDPSLFETVYALLRSPVFGMEDGAAKDMMRRCFTEETPALHESAKVHETAVESYKTYLADLEYVWAANKEMTLMSRSSIEEYLRNTRAAFKSFCRKH